MQREAGGIAANGEWKQGPQCLPWPRAEGSFCLHLNLVVCDGHAGSTMDAMGCQTGSWWALPDGDPGNQHQLPWYQQHPEVQHCERLGVAAVFP